MCAAVYRWRHLVKATKVNAGLAESNGRLLLGIWRDSLHVTCGLTACTPGSAPGPTLGNEYGKTLPFLLWHTQVVLPCAYGAPMIGHRTDVLAALNGNVLQRTSHTVSAGLR